MILLIPGVLAITGTRSLVSKYGETGYTCEDWKYQIVMNPTEGYSMEEMLSQSQDWHFNKDMINEGLEADAVNDCGIRADDTKVLCGDFAASGTRTLIFNVLNTPGTFNNVFSNDPILDTASGLPIVEVKANQCVPDNDNDGYPSSPISNVCGCTDSTIDCDDNDNTIYPGAPEIAGDGIDQDCVDGDELLPSIVSRILPSSAQQDVEFETILDVQYIGEESSLVIDERFDTSYFDCGNSAPSNKGQCNIVNNVGKVRWIITTPSTQQLKYYLVPKSTQSCYDFDIGVSGTYQFEGRSERNIPGDYVIGDMSCIGCIPSPPGAEICGNDVDEDCDGYICPSDQCQDGFYFNGAKCLNCGGIRMCANGPITYCNVADGLCPSDYGADCSNAGCADPDCS